MCLVYAEELDSKGPVTSQKVLTTHISRLVLVMKRKQRKEKLYSNLFLGDVET